MATNNNVSSVSATLSGTTADIALITQFWNAIAVTNLHASVVLYVTFDGTVAVSAAAGTFSIPPNGTRYFTTGTLNENGIAGNTTPATACHNVSVVGNANPYTVAGATLAQVQAATGNSVIPLVNTGTFEVNDNVTTHGKILESVSASGFAATGSVQVGIFNNSTDASNLPLFSFGQFAGTAFMAWRDLSQAATQSMELNVPLINGTTAVQSPATLTSEQDLMTDTIAAGQILSNLDRLTCVYTGTIANTGATTKQLRFYFAGTKILDTGALTTTGAGFWTTNIWIHRRSNTVVVVGAQLIVSGLAANAVFCQSVDTITGLNLTTNTSIIKCTATNTGTPVLGDLTATSKRGIFTR